MMKKISYSILCLCLWANLYAQPIQWQKCLGGTAWEFNNGKSNIQQTNDGGYIVAGCTLSNDGDVSGNHGDHDVWVVKLDNASNIVWQKCLGGTGYEFARSVYQTSDNGYIIAGGANLSNGDVTGNHGGGDFWVVKLDSSGNLQWQKSLGGYAEEFGWCIQQTNDGGYIVCGATLSNNGDVTGYIGGGDAWIVKLNASGAITWQKCLGGTQSDVASFIRQTPDNGYIMAGGTSSNDGDVSGNHGWEDVWVAKLDTLGNIQWQNCFGGSWHEQVHSIQPTVDGGYIFAGSTDSDDGDITGHIPGAEDFWIVKLNSSGNLVWQECLGGEGSDLAYSIQQTADGGYVATGSTSSQDPADTSFNDVVSGNHGSTDCWIVKLDSTGNLLEQLCIGSSVGEDAYTIQQTTDGGFIIGAQVYDAYNGDVSGCHGGFDFWVVKLGPNLNDLPASSNYPVNIYPNPASDLVMIDLGSTIYEKVHIQLSNIMGEILLQQEYNNTQSARILLNSYPRGLYFYTIRINGSIVHDGKLLLN